MTVGSNYQNNTLNDDGVTGIRNPAPVVPPPTQGNFGGTVLDFGPTSTPFTLLGRTGPEISSHIAYRIFMQVPIGAGVVPGFIANEVAGINVAAEFPGLNVGNTLLIWGSNIGQWIADGETGRPVVLYAFPTALETITVGFANLGAANTSAGTLICSMARIL